MITPGISFDETDAPLNNYCDILQHRAPDTWSPPNNPNAKVRFYKIGSPNPNLHGKIVCELCLVVTQHMAEQNKLNNNNK